MKADVLRRALSLIFAVVWFVPDHRAVAQEEGAAGVLEEITVTARRREESLMVTPVSITAFTTEELKARQIDQSHQIAEATPNLIYRNVTNSSNVGGSIFIRGIGQGDWVPTLQPGVGVYVDGSYVARITGSLAEIVDIESIEVLRGPQGTLFGRNTIGGAVLINTVKPNEEFGGYVDLKGGSLDLRQVKGSVNVPFSDNFFGKFSGLYREKDGYIDTPNIPEAGEFPGNETIAARVALRWLTGPVTIDWTTDYFEHQSVGPAMVLQSIFPDTFPGNNAFVYNNVTAPTLGLPPVNESFALGRGSFTNLGTDFRGDQTVDIVNTSLTAEWTIGDSLTFNSITNYRDMDSMEFRDGDGTPAQIANFTNPMESEQFSQEINLSGSLLNNRLQWVGGIYYFDETSKTASDTVFPTVKIVSGARVENSSLAVFGQFTYDLTDKASLTTGARLTDEDLDSIVDDTNQHLTAFLCTGMGGPPFCPPGFVGFVDIPPPPAPGSVRIIPNGIFESKETRTDLYFNFAYQFTDNLMSYVSYSEGFKGGGFTQRVRPGNTPQTFGPEFAEVIEWGVKLSALNNRLRLTGALFSTDYTDLQVPVTSLFGVNIENAGEAEINGGELEIASNLGDRWQFSMGLGYLDGEYKELRPGVTFSPDNRLPSLTEWQTNASVVYSTPVPVASGRILARLDHNYVGDSFTNAENNPGTLVPSRNVFNGSITYLPDSENWEVAIEGRNITDELVIEDIFGDAQANGVIMPIISPPREWAVRFRYRFF